MPFRWLFDEGQKAELSLDPLSYEQWLAFVFDHPAAKKNQDRWYTLDSAETYFYKDCRLFLERVTRLMGEPEILLGRYSAEQIKQGFWCLITGFELPDALEEKSIDFECRRDCIRSLVSLYQRLFKRPGFEKAAFMYWDPLAYSFNQSQGRPRDADHAQIQDAMFESLERILGMPERACFLGALHGLGHLRHPRAEMAIRAALARRGGLSDLDTAYAHSCIRGDMDAGPSPLSA